MPKPSEAGSDKPKAQWFLLRGLARQSAHWGEFIDTMKKAFPGWDVITLDLPGVGDNNTELAPVTIDDTAQFVRRDFKRLHKPGVPAYILSVSLGGMVATEWLRQNADGINGLVLINSSFSGVSPFYRRLQPSAYRYLLGSVIEKELDKRELQILKMISNRPAAHEALSRAWAKIQSENPISYSTFFRQFLAASRFVLPKEFESEAPPVPVLVLSSLKDQMVHPSCSKEIAKRWRAEFDSHPDAGHDLPLDDGEWVATRLKKWIAAHQNVSSDQL